MKHYGNKYKRKVHSESGVNVCQLCDCLSTCNNGLPEHCIGKDKEKGNTGYYKRVKNAA